MFNRGRLQILFIILGVFLFSFPKETCAKLFVKKPNVAYSFYAGDPKRLNVHLDRLIDKAKVIPYTHHIDVLLVPHAGYIYSGSVTAYAFKAASLNKYKTVIILAPSHYYHFDGVSVWDKGSFKTPLGLVNVDQEIAQKIIDIDDKINFNPDIFDREHSVEVQIPFIQKVFKEAKIVPLIFGVIDTSLIVKIAKSLRYIIGRRQDVLIVVSSDLSHYFSDKKARKLDKVAIDSIRRYDIENIIRNNNKTLVIDGIIPVLTAMVYAKNKGLKHIDMLKYSHSGHMTGEMDRVVGYVSLAFHKKEYLRGGGGNDSQNISLTVKQKRKLLDIANKTMKKYIYKKKKYKVKKKDEYLRDESNGVFVTLYKNGKLRGCMGNVIGDKPLGDLVRDMTIVALTQDLRFDPVDKNEVKDIVIEVSILSPPYPIESVDEIEMGTHGVILSQGNNHQGVFLPQVAIKMGWDKERFLSELSSHKAGLLSDSWRDPKTVIEIFTVDFFSSENLF